jgi:hypothetical protein
MSAHEWFVAAAFVGLVYGLSFISPEGATALALFVGVVAFVKSGIAQKLGVQP